MNCRILILFFITFILEDITTSPSNYDITKTLENSIQSMHSSVSELYEYLSNEKQKPQGITFNSKVENKTYVCELNLYSYKWDDFDIYSNFINNKVGLTVKRCDAKNKGWIRENGNPQCKHFTDHRIFYRTIIMESDGSSLNASRGDFYIFGYFNESGEAKDLTENLLKPSLVEQTMNKLVESISPRIKKFAVDLSNHTRTIFTSNHPDFLRDEEKHFYLITNISVLMCFDLRNITIKGLTNFHSLEISKGQMSFILRTRNIRGEMVLDYGSEVETPMELNFAANYFIISFNSNKSSINVELRNCRVFRTTQNTTLTDDQSTMIIQHIESTMASSLMPSMEVWWTDDQLLRKSNMESLAGEMLTVVQQKSDFDTKKKALKKWIPFNDDCNK